VTALALALVVVGVGASIATLWHDLQRLRVGAVAPQAAPKRLPPEIHTLGAVLTGIGCWLFAGWVYGVGGVVAQLVLAYAGAPPLLDALADRLTTRPPSPGK